MTDIDKHEPYLAGRHLAPDVPRPTAYYQFMRCMTYLTTSLIFRTHIIGHTYEPDSGGVLLMGNHQSYLDPILAAMGLRRAGNFMARKSLFFSHFGKLIASLNSFPVNRGAGDTGAMKEAIRRLRDKKMVVIFPEGTRSDDGRIYPFLPGAALLGMRAAEWTLPVLVEGAQDVWPRGVKFPYPGHVYIRYGRPIHCSEAKAMGPQKFVNHVRDILIDMQHDMRERLGKPLYDYSLPFPDRTIEG